MKVKIDPGAYLPTRAHETDAGLDLYSMEDKTVWPLKGKYDLGELTIQLSGGTTFDTGVHMAIPKGYFGKIESRSGLNVINSVVSCGGIIDSNYRGSIKVKLYNLGEDPYTVHKGDRIAQIIITKYEKPKLELVSVLDDTDRGEDGFGSSGK